MTTNEEFETLVDALVDATETQAVVEAAREWVAARRSYLDDWLFDRSTPRNDAETDRRSDRCERAEKALRAALRALDGGTGTNNKETDR